MADKSVGELIAAESVTPTDLFVLEQNGTAKKLTGQILENWLVSFADGHGGIQSIVKIETNVLVDTYRITLADTTTFDFVVTNGRGVNSITKKSTSGLVDTYTITYNDGTTGTFTVTNGAKGDKGDNAYIWVKYASQEPTASSNSFGDLPDDWMGVYFGFSSTAPTDWQQYAWYKIKGEQGDTGEPATLVSSDITYQAGDSGTIIPSDSWSSSVPPVTPGRYLWTRQVLQFNTGAPITSYSVSRFGIDGTGAVSTVAGVSPDSNGNVPLDAASVKALALSGGTMEGPINMNGQTLSGLNAPTENDHAANMGFVNHQVKNAAPRNLLDNSGFTNPVNQREKTSYTGAKYGIDRWVSEGGTGVVSIEDGSVNMKSSNGSAAYITQFIEAGKIKNGRIYTVACQLSDGSVWLKSGVASVDMGSTVIKYMTYNGSEIGAIRFTYDTNKNLYKVMFNTTSTSGMNVVWVALYEGEYTADNLPAYQPKGYGAELAECLRYFERQNATDVHAIGTAYYAGSATILRTTIMYHPKRIVPTVTLNFSSSGAIVNGAYVTISKTTSFDSSKTMSVITFETSAGTTAMPAAVYAIGYIDISADL